MFMKKSQLGRSGIGIILAVLVIIVIGVVYFATRQVEESPETVEDIKMDQEMIDMMSAEAPPSDGSVLTAEEAGNAMDDVPVWTMEGDLLDVADGNSTGIARSAYEDGVYSLEAVLQDLPDPESFGEGFFYEGWIVRRTNFHVLSTGAIRVEDGAGVNAYFSGQDWSDHDFYVLTIEPDDGDPAPADHILEGVLLPL